MAPVTRLGGLDTPVPFSPPLEDAYRPNAQKIYEAAQALAGLLTMTVDQKLDVYYWMQLTRTFDERMLAHWKQGRGVGGTFSQRGHEAISVGAAYALGPDDVVSPMHRDLGAFLLRGLTPRQIFGNLLGRETGPTRGRDANLHGVSQSRPRHHRFHQPPAAFVTGGAWRGDELSLSRRTARRHGVYRRRRQQTAASITRR